MLAPRDVFADGALEHDAIMGQGVEGGCFHGPRAVASYVVGAQGIDRDQDDIRP